MRTPFSPDLSYDRATQFDPRLSSDLYIFNLNKCREKHWDSQRGMVKSGKVAAGSAIIEGLVISGCR